jgi:hypothetical protein
VCLDRVGIKPIERRTKTLKEHIRQGKIYIAHRPLYEQYQNQKPRKRKEFYEANRAGLTLYETAKRYLKSVLNGHPLPLESWKDEYSKLTIRRGGIYREYSNLKVRVYDVETVKYFAMQFTREAARMKRPEAIKPPMMER